MKRLIKKSEFDYNRFLKLLINDNVYYQEEISKVISENPDCEYNGMAFRVFFFYKDAVKQAKETYLKSINVEEGYQVDIFELLWGTLDNLIDVDGQFQSFSKSESGIQNVDNHQRDGQEYAITIKFDVSGALDIEKLCEKYIDLLDDETKDAVTYFKNQEEVLAKLNVEDYYYVGGIDFSDLRYL